MKQLTAVVLVAVVAVVGRVVEGKVFTKCDLVSAIMKTFPTIGQNTLDKVVCFASQASNFNSNLLSSAMINGQDADTYGIFQIPHHFCDGKNPELNICDSGCDKYRDNILTDDIQCVDKIKNKFLSNPVAASGVLKDVISQLFSPYCKSSDGPASDCDVN